MTYPSSPPLQSINAAMARAKSYHIMDAFVKLVVVLVRYSGDTANVVTKINLLNKVRWDGVEYNYDAIQC